MLRRGFARTTFLRAPYKDRAAGILFTAGPLSTSKTVRMAQMEDYGSRDTVFVNCIKEVRSGLVDVAGAKPTEWTAVPMQGSGSMGIEAVVNTVTPRMAPKWFVCHNGAYGRRMQQVTEKLGFQTDIFETEEGKEMDLATLEAKLKASNDSGNPVTNFGVVHCETSTGMFNPIEEIAPIVRRVAPSATIFVDAMSSFGAVSFSTDASCDILVTSANKCIQGVPGFSIVLARQPLLNRCRGNSRSFTLDVASQRDALDKTSQFPHTPPVQAIVAFRQALKEHSEEGGVKAREARYKALCKRTMDGMQALGFELFLDPTKKSFGHIITAYKAPQHPNWNFMKFYDLLKDAGIVIYPGKASHADTFRIGSLGDLQLEDVENLLVQAKKALQTMNCDLRSKK